MREVLGNTLSEAETGFSRLLQVHGCVLLSISSALSRLAATKNTMGRQCS